MDNDDEFRFILKRYEIDLIISSLKDEAISGMKVEAMGGDCPQEEWIKYLDLMAKMISVMNPQ